MDIEIFSQDKAPNWNAFLDKSPHSSIFHRWEWLKIVENYTGSTLHPCGIYNGNELVALYPFYMTKKRNIRMAFSPPSHAYLMYLGPIIADYDYLSQKRKEDLLLKIQEVMNFHLFKELKCQYVRIRTVPALIDLRPFMWQNYSVSPQYTYLLNLRKGPAVLWDNLDSILRKNIKKMKNGNISLIDGTLRDVSLLHESLGNRFSNQGIVHSNHEVYLNNLFKCFSPDNLKVFMADNGDRHLGGVVALFYKEKVYFWIGNPKPPKEYKSINEYVTWESIQKCYDMGYHSIEIMDAGDNPRLRYFKAKFNPDLAIWFTAEKYSSSLYRMLGLIKKTLGR